MLHFRFLIIAFCLSCFPLSICWGEGPTSTPRRQYQPIDNWRDDIIYAVFVDRYQDGNTQNNFDVNAEKLDSFQGGDFQGIIDRLDYLKDLGVTTILLNPVMHSDTYHGYHPREHFKTNSRYGSLEDFERLVQETHKRGMKLLFDLVLNHVAGDSEFRKEHANWFRPEMHYQAKNESGFHEVKSRATFYLLPDFDHENEEVYQYLLKVAKFWIDKGIDGFRMDAVTQIEPAFWKRFNADLKQYAGNDFFILGEIFEYHTDVLNLYTPYFDSIFDFRAYFVFHGVFAGTFPPIELYFLFALDALYSNQNLVLAPFLDNHDVSRFISDYAALQKDAALHIPRLKQALSTLFTSRGLPYLLYGTEIGLGNTDALKHLDYDKARSKMIFQDNSDHPVYKHLKKLIEIRKRFHLGRAERKEIARQGEVLGYALMSKRSDAPPILVVQNFKPTSNKKIRTSVRFQNLFPPNSVLVDLLTGQTFTMRDEIIRYPMNPFQVRIFTLRDRPN